MGYATVSDLSLRLDRMLPTLPGGLPVSLSSTQDTALQIALWTGLAVLGISLLMLALIVLLRVSLILRQRRQRRFIMKWQPLLAECTFQVPEKLPRIPRAMRYTFLKLWTYHLESLAGATRGNLVQLAQSAGMSEIVRDMVAQGNLRKKLIAVVALGHLGDKTRWHELRLLVGDPSPMLSLAAARALLDIDARATLPWLITVIGAREDWPMAKIAAMLKDIGPDLLTTPLIAATEAAAAAEDGSHQVPRLLRLMAVAHSERAAPALRRILSQTEDPDVIAAALRVLRDPEDVTMMRGYVRHANWVVRISAVRALGHIGMPEDRKLLTDLLSDEHWWVRYHAARALIALPFTTLVELDKIRSILPDRFAADMLKEALAEERAS